MKKCVYCNIETNNPKFCSRSCAAKFTNKTPKRKRTKTCKNCNAYIRSDVSYCTLCWKEQIIPNDILLSEAIYTKHHKSSAFALIRQRARKIASDNNMSVCENCGYSKHVEIAHILPISSFSLDTPLSVINDVSNLKALCPNCHWEFDNLSPCQDSNLGPIH